jgi:hypothetical protein
MHVDFARVKEYYMLFCSNFSQVDYFFIQKDGYTNFDINNISLDNYDFIFIYHEATIERLLNKYNKSDLIKIISKKPSFIQLDCTIWQFTKDKDIMSLFNAVGIAYPYTINEIENNNKYIIFNATINRNFIKTNVNDDIVYIGRIKKVYNKILEFSNIIKKTINLYTFDYDIEYAKILNQEKFINYKGCLKYNELDKAIINSSYGLCFYDNPSPCGKIFDYISYGLPVLAENKIGESEIIKKYNLGILFDYNKLNEFQLPEKYFNNVEIYNNVQENHLWKNRIDLWIDIIKNNL